VGENAPKESEGAQSPSQFLLQSSNEGLLAQGFSEEDIRGHDGPPAKDGAQMTLRPCCCEQDTRKSGQVRVKNASMRVMTSFWDRSISRNALASGFNRGLVRLVPSGWWSNSNFQPQQGGRCWFT